MKLLSRIKEKIIGSLSKELSDYHIRKNLPLLTLGAHSRIYEEAKIGNLSKDPGKITVGEHTHIRGVLHNFWSGGRIEIGDYCYIGENARIWAASHVKIGNRVMIAHNVNIHDNISHPVDPELRHLDYKRILGLSDYKTDLSTIHTKPVVIEDDVWIGFNAIILKGVTIGRGAVIGAGSVVGHDIPEYAVVVGNPSRIIRYVTKKE